MKGVILAGGTGSRLGDLTKVTNKHLLPVGDMPMIYYPLKKMVGAGVREIMVVTGREHMGDFVDLLGSGKDHGANLTYRVQDEAGGIAQALSLAESFVGSDRCLVILGDNVFCDPIPTYLIPELGSTTNDKSWVFLKEVYDPHRFGVATLGRATGKFLRDIVEKPTNLPPFNDTSRYLAVVGVYVYQPDVFQVIRGLKPSKRGELEITDVNNHYLRAGRLNWCELKQWWTDAGTYDSLHLANQMVREKPPQW